MKLVTLMLSLLLSSGCTPTSTTSTLDVSEEKELEEISVDSLAQAIALAEQNKDYRLLVTSGRSISVPGVKPSDYERVIGLCGKNYAPETGDVLSSEAQRQDRKQLVEYMRQYNVQMLIICQENTK
jgi:hypothetical protein